ncbi:hypothetical protein J6590_073913 [Homalodisca vitripennis]|nr:hypothetical protein J6590_073913 [Homalodisca vitripennis]
MHFSSSKDVDVIARDTEEDIGSIGSVCIARNMKYHLFSCEANKNLREREEQARIYRHRHRFFARNKQRRMRPGRAGSFGSAQFVFTQRLRRCTIPSLD